MPGGFIIVLIRRLKKLPRTMRWMYPLCQGPGELVKTLIRRRSNPDRVLTLHYRGLPVHFRGSDSDALEEVLHLEEYSFLASFLSETERPLVIDVGSHIGTFGLFALAINPQSEIVGIEADPSTFDVALRNIPTHNKTWRMHNRAAFGESGVPVFLQTSGPSMGHHLSPDGGIEVNSIDLNEALALGDPHRRISLLKIDVEGAEEAFLCGNTAPLARVDRLVVELHPSRCDVALVRKVLEAEFEFVDEVSRDWSSKPLLHCRRIP